MSVSNFQRQKIELLSDQDSRKFENGLFLYNLPNFITQEMLWFNIKQIAGPESVLQVIVPRNRNTNQHPGYGFLQLQSREQAINLRKKINFMDILGSKIKVSIIGKKEDHASVVVKNVPSNTEESVFEEICSKYGVIYSSKVDVNPNFQGEGKYLYVQFEKNAEAEAFIKAVNENQIEALKGDNIQALNWNRVARSEAENQSLFFRDYQSANLPDDIFEDEEKLQEETNKIAEQIKDYYKDFKIISLYVKIDPVFKSPISFVGFETHAEAERAQALAQNNPNIPFKFIVYCKTFQQLRDEREKKADDRYIYMKNLKSTVTEESLRAAIEKVSQESFPENPIKITSIRLQEPKNQPEILTKFATVVLETGGLLQHLKVASKNNNTDFFKLFSDKKAFVHLLHHKFHHKKFLTTRRIKQTIEQSRELFNSGIGRPNFPFPVPQGLGLPRNNLFGPGFVPPGLPVGNFPAPMLQPPGLGGSQIFQPPFLPQNLPPNMGNPFGLPQFIPNRFQNPVQRNYQQQGPQQFPIQGQFGQQRIQNAPQIYQQQPNIQYPQQRQGYRGGVQNNYYQGGQRQGGYQGGQNRPQNPQYQNQIIGQQQQPQQQSFQRPPFNQGQQQPQGGNRPQSQGNFYGQGQNRPQNAQNSVQSGQAPRQIQQQGAVPSQGVPKPITGQPKQIQQVTGQPKQIQGPNTQQK